MQNCIVGDCGRRHRAKGYCARHYARFIRYGDPLAGSTFRKCGPRERRAGPRRDPKGYVHLYMPEHPLARNDGSVLEHVLVMSGVLGRALLPGETVHHKNGIRDDNRPENLELWAKNHPAGQRVADLLLFAKDIIERYGDATEAVLNSTTSSRRP